MLGHHFPQLAGCCDILQDYGMAGVGGAFGTEVMVPHYNYTRTERAPIPENPHVHILADTKGACNGHSEAANRMIFLGQMATSRI